MARDRATRRRLTVVRSFLLASLLLLGACAPATTREAFLAGFTPSAQIIHKYERIKHTPYTPQVEARGLVAVQRAVNAVPYRADGSQAAWAPPARFWKQGGDCEDFALTKGAELKAQGYSHLFLTVVRARTSGRAHALLVVEDDGRMLALDNIETDVMGWADAVRRYRPLYALDLRSGQVLIARDDQRPLRHFP